ncbi:mechanosensitive ion channel family protein [Chitinophaga rhizophila]|uniref:Mechanosensitive ion channel family protein n=1 Tax=Chitinophaga rhizophila TaxID=2866212 RepID=A0ABS7GD44_9BACT|nr:mechanosensitive ion channel family protein [Chitinophaga rhizophila]MBW8684418.1 mechanosensitive ion channel family protein [Chitinophaga rhizophila]
MNTDYTQWGDLIWDKLHRWTTATIKMMPNMAVAVLVIVAFYLLARLIRMLTYKFVLKISHTPALSGLFANLISVIVTLIGLFVALDVLKLEKAVSSLLAGAGIIGLALGFAFQDLTSNFISGIFITFKRPFEIGHQIETNGFSGNVEEIQLRATRLRTLDGLHVIIPNKDIFQKPIINHSLTPERRAEITFNAAAANENTLGIKQLIREALKEVDNLSTTHEPDVYFTNIDGANLKVTVSCWIINQDIRTFESTKNEIIMKITAVLKDSKLI